MHVCCPTQPSTPSTLCLQGNLDAATDLVAKSAGHDKLCHKDSRVRGASLRVLARLAGCAGPLQASLIANELHAEVGTVRLCPTGPALCGICAGIIAGRVGISAHCHSASS